MPAHYKPLQAFTIGLGFRVQLGLFSPIGYFTVSHTSSLYRPAPAQKQRRSFTDCTVYQRFTDCTGLHHYSASACTVLVRLHRFGASLPYPALKARGGATGLYYYYSTYTDLQEGKIALICYKKAIFITFMWYIKPLITLQILHCRNLCNFHAKLVDFALFLC